MLWHLGVSMNDNPKETKFVAQLTEVQLPLRLYVQALLPGDSAAHDVVQQANAMLSISEDLPAPFSPKMPITRAGSSRSTSSNTR